MQYYRFNIGDWQRSCAHLTLAETGAYLRLLNIAYDTELPLPLDHALLYKMVGAKTKAEKRAVDFCVRQHFLCGDSGYHNDRVSRELASIYSKSEKASNSALRKWAKYHANAERTQCDGNANAMLPNTQYKSIERKSATATDELPSGGVQ